MEAQSVSEAIQLAEEAAYTAREAIRAKVEVVEQKAAELAKAGDYVAAIAKYEEGERGREAYERLCSDSATFNAIIRRFPGLSAMPPERDEFGIGPKFVPGDVVKRRDGSVVVVLSLPGALVAIATTPKGGLHRTWNNETHNFCADGSNLRTDISAIPRWIIAELQAAGAIESWTRVVGHHGYVVAGINPKRACELLMGDLTALETRCVEAFVKLRAVHDERVAAEEAKRIARNKRARERRSASKTTPPITSP